MGKRARQIELAFRTWGGKRRGAGRKRVLPGKSRIPHGKREAIPARIPAHVTLRIARDLPTLRTRRAFTAVARALWSARAKLGMRLVHFSVQSNHLHLIVEGVNGAAMKGLGVRIARSLNRLLERRGRVIDDHYHAHALRTPAEVRNAVHYVLSNHQKHTGFAGVDEFSSVGQPQIVVPAATWLLRRGPPSG
jgi:REP element-mobilizing transposase RayT